LPRLFSSASEVLEWKDDGSVSISYRTSDAVTAVFCNSDTMFSGDVVGNIKFWTLSVVDDPKGFYLLMYNISDFEGL
jgi:hypothetical protein